MNTKATTDSPFPVPWFSAFFNGPPMRTLAEWAIYDIIIAIREKPDWQTKYKDDAIFNKWKGEFEAQVSEKVVNLVGQEGIDGLFDFVKKDLEWFEKFPSKVAGFDDFSIEFDHMICSSNKAISEEVKKDLQQKAQQLYDLFDELDYHPNSDEKVVDLVHPSLYLLEYGVTPILVDGKVEVLKFDKDRVTKVKAGVDSWGVSSLFQWIPALFELKDGRYKIASYINNLHPKDYESLYETIEDIFNLSIPGLNYTLSRYACGLDNRIKYPTDIYEKGYRELEQKYFDSYDDDLNRMDYEEDVMSRRSEFVKPLDLKYVPPKESDFNLNKFDNLKVIVKMANIELTPEKPTYDGGSWHIEGCINEDIVATILYYYDVENITESKLSFNMAFDDPPYEQNDDFYCKHLFDLHDEGSLQRGLGSVTINEGKLLIFPNGYQHHVDAFELKDKTKPGYRKILCYFLVDPHNDVVISSKDVPPQQAGEKWQSLVDNSILLQIGELGEEHTPKPLETAKTIRGEFMEDRGKHYIEEDEYTDMPYLRKFSLCEH